MGVTRELLRNGDQSQLGGEIIATPLLSHNTAPTSSSHSLRHSRRSSAGIQRTDIGSPRNLHASPHVGSAGPSVPNATGISRIIQHSWFLSDELCRSGIVHHSLTTRKAHGADASTFTDTRRMPVPSKSGVHVGVGRILRAL